MNSSVFSGGGFELPFRICNTHTSEEIRPCANDVFPWVSDVGCCVRSEVAGVKDPSELVPDDQATQPWLFRDHDSVCEADGERVLPSPTWDSSSFPGCGRFPDFRLRRTKQPLVKVISPGIDSSTGLVNFSKDAPDCAVVEIFVPPVMPRVPATPAGHLGMKKPELREATLRRKPAASQTHEIEVFYSPRSPLPHKPRSPPPAKVEEVEPTVIPVSLDDEDFVEASKAEVDSDMPDAGDIEFGWEKKIGKEEKAKPSAKRPARAQRTEAGEAAGSLSVDDAPAPVGHPPAGDATVADSSATVDDATAPAAEGTRDAPIDDSPAGDQAVAATPSPAAHGSGAVRVLIAVSAESASADKLEEWCRVCGIEYLMVVKAEAAAGLATWRRQVCKAFGDLCEQSW